MQIYSLINLVALINILFTLAPDNLGPI